MLFGRGIAWASVAVFALLPLSWVIAPSLGGYCYAFLPLFLSFGTFIRFRATRPWIAVVLSGIFFGLTLGIQHSYLAFLPWFVVVYLWQKRQQLLVALVHVGIFSATAYAMFLLPMVPAALQQSTSPLERFTTLLSPMKESTPGEGHLYPDEFLFEHYKEEYDAKIRARVGGSSFIENLEDKNYRIIFGVDDFTVFEIMATGAWMFINSIPDHITVDNVGGAFLWLFILPGIAIAWRTHRLLVLWIGGLIISMEIVLRFLLLFVSSHISNYTWALALFAGIGVKEIVGTLGRSWKLTAMQRSLLAFFIVCIIGVQLLQANRKVLAQLYSRSRTPELLAATAALLSVPDDAVVASPRRSDLFFLSPQRNVSIHPTTIDFLSQRGKLMEPFKYYGVTHIIGYADKEERAIKRIAPGVDIIELAPVPVESSLTPFIRYLLQTFR